MPNHNIFDEWTEQSAYLLGFWYADGHIEAYAKRGKKYKRFCLSNTDKQIMDDLAKILDRPHYKNVPQNTKHKICFKISFHSDKLFDYCYQITGTTQKSKQGSLPDIPIEFLRHFVRGFFDGDGSIHITTYKNRHGKDTTELRTSFSAGNETGNMLEKLRDTIREHIPIGKRKAVGKTGKKIAFGQYDSALLCEWMYKDAIVFMERKKEIWDSADKAKLRRSKKFFSNKV
jgi:hypothetical protein